MTITKDDVLPLLFEACPSFLEGRWQENQTAFNDDRELLYLDIAGFARYLADLLAEGKTEEFPAIFAVIERLHTEGDHYVQELATVGFLEDFENWAMRADMPESACSQHFGPQTAEWFKEMQKFWRREIGYIGETYRGFEDRS